jgi:hypothetical protein
MIYSPVFIRTTLAPVGLAYTHEMTTLMQKHIVEIMADKKSYVFGFIEETY